MKMCVRIAFRYAILGLALSTYQSPSFAQGRQNTVAGVDRVTITGSIKGPYPATEPTLLHSGGDRDLHSSAKEGNAEQNNKLVPSYGNTSGGLLD